MITVQMEGEDYKEFLASVIKFNRCNTIVEIGVQFGFATQYFCEAAKFHNGFVYGYDIFDRHGLLKQHPGFATMEDVNNRLLDLKLTNFKLTKVDTYSEEFRKIIKQDTVSNIDFAFIDACHSYKGIKNDFDVVYPLLSAVGIVAFHDTSNIDGCREFMIDLRTKYYDGTYDVVDFPWGFFGRRCGVSLLVKRSYPVLKFPIIEVCNLEDTRETILEKEQLWYDSEVAHAYLRK